MNIMEALRTRTTPREFEHPAPSNEELLEILSAAVRAPDHGRLKPWSFLVIRGEGRHEFGELMAQALKLRLPDSSESRLEMERAKPMAAPLIVIVTASVQKESKVPEIEQIAAVSAAAENLLLAAHGLGFGGAWRTGAAAYDRNVKLGLGLDESDHILGFLYLGKVRRTGVLRAADLEGVMRDWPPANAPAAS